MLTAKSSALAAAYEAQLENVAEELTMIGNGGGIETLDLSIPYRTALSIAVCLLKSPYVVWYNLSLLEQHRLFYFIFEEKLRYHIADGYRTDLVPSPVRLFEEYAQQNTLSVVMGRLELPPLAGHASETCAYTNSAT